MSSAPGKPTAKTDGTTRRDPDDKRARLLDAGRHLFLMQGFEGTTTLSIARRAGVSEGILFHHFGSKRGLFEALASDFATAAADATMPAETDEMTEESVVRAAFDFADAQPALYDLFSRRAADNEDTSALNADIVIDKIRANLELGIAAGQARAGDPRIMAELQFALVDAAYRAWRRRGDPGLREAYIFEAVRCMRGMLAPQAPKS
ncbi:MAG: helix-turn-helix domain-containing protein [Pseudomonadota bacterium]